MQQSLFTSEQTKSTMYYFGEVVPVYRKNKRSAGLANATKVNDPDSMAAYFRSIWAPDMALRERLYAVFFNSVNKVVGHCELSSGGMMGTVCDRKLLFQSILLCPGAVAFAVAHCHPSGGLTPSDTDNEMTKRLVRSSKELDIEFIDHVILTVDSYVSYACDQSLQKYLS